MKPFTLILMPLLLMGSAALPAYAQEDGNYDDEGVYGYSSLEATSSTDLVGYSETDLDDSVTAYYVPKIIARILNPSNQEVAWGTEQGQDGDTEADITLQYDSATPNSTYTLRSTHDGILSISDPCDGCGDDYLDYFDYIAYEPLDISAPFDYPFAPQGPPRSAPQVIPLGSTYDEVTATTPAACGDVRDTIIKEYQTYDVGVTPTCSSFTQTASTAHFTFDELNSGDYSWAILQAILLSGIETVRTDNGNVALTVNSGYRNPKKQVTVIGGPADSQHVLGDAVDFASNAGTWQALHNAGKQAGGCVEPTTTQNNSFAHVHIDWRGACPRDW